MKKYHKYVIFASIAAFIICLDQLTKIYIHTHFSLGESIVAIQDYFNITYVRNKGAAFGILSNSHELFRKIFFLSLPPIAVLFVIQILRNVPSDDKFQIIALSGIAGGALGNYVDRVKYGYVVDFLDFHFKEIYAWPAFNVADMAIVGGVGILMMGILTESKKEKQKAKNKKSKSKKSS